MIIELTESSASALACSQGSTSEEIIFNEERAIDESVVNWIGNQAEDVALVCNQGIKVEDDNKTAPKNVPFQSASLTINLYLGRTLGWDGIDQLLTQKTMQVLKMVGPTKENNLLIFSISSLLFVCLIVAWTLALKNFKYEEKCLITENLTTILGISSSLPLAKDGSRQTFWATSPSIQ